MEIPIHVFPWLKEIASFKHVQPWVPFFALLHHFVIVQIIELVLFIKYFEVVSDIRLNGFGHTVHAITHKDERHLTKHIHCEDEV